MRTGDTGCSGTESEAEAYPRTPGGVPTDAEEEDDVAREATQGCFDGDETIRYPK